MKTKKSDFYTSYQVFLSFYENIQIFNSMKIIIVNVNMNNERCYKSIFSRKVKRLLIGFSDI